MTPTELKRLYHIIKVQLEYGLDELMPEHHLTKAPVSYTHLTLPTIYSV